jgi:hypothetical protein
MRWRVECDYEDLKQEIGLGHYEGRGWPGFHNHSTLCIAAYGFLISEREGFPPSAPYSAAPISAAPIEKSKNLPFPVVIDPEVRGQFRTIAGGQRPVLALDVVDDGRARPR